MEPHSWSSSLVIGVAVGLAAVLFSSVIIFVLCNYYVRNRTKRCKRDVEQPEEVDEQSQQREPVATVSLRINDHDSSTELSDSSEKQVTPVRPSGPKKSRTFFTRWVRRPEKCDPSNSFKTSMFTYGQLRKATHGFKTLVGSGASGKVYKGTLPSGQIIAIKKLNRIAGQSNKEFQRQVMLLERLHHRNLVNLVGYCINKPGRNLLAYEYMTNGSLFTWLHGQSQQHLTWQQRVTIAQDMARGIEYLHKGAIPPVIHRNIKSSNILLDASMTARVCDFGLSKEAILGRAPSGVRGTIGYVDPAYVKSNVLTDKSDVYSFGILLFELISGRKPQHDFTDCINNVMVQRASWLDLLDIRLQGHCNVVDLNAMASIALQCLHEDPCQRPSMRKISMGLSSLGTSKPRTS